MSLRARLERLEGGGGCPECEDAREEVLAAIFSEGRISAPDNCPNCGRDARPTVFDFDRIQKAGGEGVRS